MSYGLTNASAYFMHLMNKVFVEYQDKFVIVFIGDMLIFSQSKEEHEQPLRSFESTNFMPSSENANSGCTKLDSWVIL